VSAPEIHKGSLRFPDLSPRQRTEAAFMGSLYYTIKRRMKQPPLFTRLVVSSALWRELCFMRKWIAWLLLLVLGLSLLTACQKEQPSLQQSIDTKVEQAPAPQPESPAEAPADEPATEPVEEPIEEPVEEPAEEPVEKPAEEPVEKPSKPVLKPVSSEGETMDAGCVSAWVPAGWKGFTTTDVFSEDNAIDPDVLNIIKDGQSDLDIFTNPYIRIDHFGPDTLMMEPDMEWYDEPEELEPFTAGPYEWRGFSCTSLGMPLVILWTEDGDHQYQAAVYLDTERETIELFDPDVQAILGSIAATDGVSLDAPMTQDPEHGEEFESDFDWWAGDWYGWWCVYSGFGAYEQYENIAWDAYARIDVFGDGTGYVSIWDTETGAGDFIASSYVHFENSDAEGGCMVLDEGIFFDAKEWLPGVQMPEFRIPAEEWWVDPTFSTVSHFDHMVEIEGWYEDPENPDNGFYYCIYLRPWGVEWEDVREGDTSGCIYSDMMPLYYDDWYLPLLEKGEPMPDTFADGWALLE